MLIPDALTVLSETTQTEREPCTRHVVSPQQRTSLQTSPGWDCPGPPTALGPRASQRLPEPSPHSPRCMYQGLQGHGGSELRA